MPLLSLQLPQTVSFDVNLSQAKADCVSFVEGWKGHGEKNFSVNEAVMFFYRCCLHWAWKTAL